MAVDDATRLLVALGGAKAIIDRRRLSSSDDFAAIARAVALDARNMGIDTTEEAARVLAYQLRLRELAPGGWTPPTLADLAESTVRCSVGWADALLERVAKLAQDNGDLAATVALAAALDPHGEYIVRRLRRAG